MNTVDTEYFENDETGETKQAEFSMLLEEARSQLKAGQCEEAIRCLTRVLMEAPEEFEPRYLLGIAYGQAEDFTKAIELFSSALRVNPHHAACWFHLGQGYQAVRDDAAAAAAFDHCLKINPEHSRASEALQALRRKHPSIFQNSLNQHPPIGEENQQRFPPNEGSQPRIPPTPNHPSAVSQNIGKESERSLVWESDAIAPLTKRWAAAFIDSFILTGIGAVAGATGFDRLLPFPGFSVGILYEIFSLTYYGQTVGKYFMDIQVDRVDGYDITWKEATIRSMVKGLFHGLQGSLYYLGLTSLPRNLSYVLMGYLMVPATPTFSELWALTNRKRQALHDVAAQTLLVNA
jgi:uncharacterized RDD family membrane protein YckC